MSLSELKKDLYKLKSPVKAKLLQRFFKTGKGEYAEGDKFLGVTVPQSRALVKKYWRGIRLPEIDRLVKSPFHEERLIGLLILVKKFEKGDSDKEKNFKYYLSRAKYINNWDLVDLTAPKIIGAYLRSRDKSILIKLAQSKNLWERRIAILATFDFIYFNNPAWTIKLSKLLLRDEHDLIHKAVGWMLRETGKRCNKQVLLKFLDYYSKRMPRTMLRYAIEKLSPKLKVKYMAK